MVQIKKTGRSTCFKNIFIFFSSNLSQQMAVKQDDEHI